MNNSFWNTIQQSAALSQSSPDWMKAGINLNPQHFITYLPIMKNKKHKNKTPRNPAALPAKQRKAGKHKPKSQKRQNGKNKQQELLKENDQ